MIPRPAGSQQGMWGSPRKPRPPASCGTCSESTEDCVVELDVEELVLAGGDLDVLGCGERLELCAAGEEAHVTGLEAVHAVGAARIGTHVTGREVGALQVAI